jgi:hypothetical protein
MFKIVDFAHFLSIYSQSGRNSKNYFSFDVHQRLSSLYSENDVSGISTQKALYQNVERTPFFGIFDPIADL